MNRRLTRLALTFLTASITLPALAQNMKPGLWEINNKITSQNSRLAQQMSQMQKQIASMPPEQRKAMEQMMAKHSGVNMPTMTDDGMRVKMCMSSEMVAQNQLPVQQQGNCTHNRIALAGNSMKVTFVCTNPESSGEGTVQFLSNTAYTMQMAMTATVEGKKEVTSMEAKGKWLGANCGNIKPVALPPAAK
jgi:hypothetical protein